MFSFYFYVPNTTIVSDHFFLYSHYFCNLYQNVPIVWRWMIFEILTMVARTAPNVVHRACLAKEAFRIQLNDWTFSPDWRAAALLLFNIKRLPSRCPAISNSIRRSSTDAVTAIFTVRAPGNEKLYQNAQLRNWRGFYTFVIITRDHSRFGETWMVLWYPVLCIWKYVWTLNLFKILF